VLLRERTLGNGSVAVIATSFNSGRQIGQSGNLLVSHALGVHGIQAIPAVSVIVRMAGTRLHQLTLLHAAGIGWLTAVVPFEWLGPDAFVTSISTNAPRAHEIEPAIPTASRCCVDRAVNLPSGRAASKLPVVSVPRNGRVERPEAQGTRSTPKSGRRRW
jgi:hypothetical protein